MIELGKRSFAPYVSIVFYALLIFFTQWSLAAARMNENFLHNILANITNFIILPSILVLALYSIVINFKCYVRHKWFTMIFIIILLFIATISKSASLSIPLLIGFTAFYANERKIAKVAVLSFAILLAVSCIFSFLGLNGGDSISKPLFGVDETYATALTALGLSNPNSVMLIFFNVIALLLFLCNTKRQVFYASVTLVILTIVLSISTGSTTGLIIGILTVLLVLIAKRGKRLLEIIRKTTPWMFTLVTIATFVIAINFGSFLDRQNPINNTLTGRPYLWNLRIENKSYINLYGGNDKYQGTADFALDNTPLYILVYYGIILYIAFIYIFYSGTKKIKEPELIAYILAATLLMFAEKMELYGLVLVFLQKGITEHQLLSEKNIKRI